VIECDARCWKKQRDEKIASAFASSADFEKNKGSINFEYYPEEAIQFAQENLAWAKKVESALTYIVMNKSPKSYNNLTAPKRNFISLLVYEHFRLDMCVYGGGMGQKKVTDVFWREGCKIPEIMCSEIAELINKGIDEVKQESKMSTIFEASINIYNVPTGSGFDTLKKFLSSFKNEMYTERGSTVGTYHIHFYSKQRAKDALTFIQEQPNQFSNCEMVLHRKEIGTLGETTEENKEETGLKRKGKTRTDDDGWTT